MTPLVTAVVPTRDRRSLVRHTVEAVLDQREVPVDVVVVDDGSTDGTPESLSRHFGDRVRVCSGRGAGAAAARNVGLAEVRTPWVAFCDDDDLWAPDKLARQLAAAEREPAAGWVACGSVLVSETGEILDHQRLAGGGWVGPLLLAGNPVPGGGSGVLARSELVRGVGGFREDLRNAEDWDLWIRLAHAAPLAVVDAPLVAYRVWPGSKSRSTSRMEVAWDDITTTYRALSEAAGIDADRHSHGLYLAKQQLRHGQGRAAAATYLRLAREHGDVRSLVRAVAAAVAPGVMDRVGTRRAQRRVPPSWRVSVAWIEDRLEGTRDDDTHTPR